MKLKDFIANRDFDVNGDYEIYYGTWDESYSTYWSRNNNIVKTITNGREGFKDFVCTDREIMQSKGVFIITENEELLKQIDILKKKAELV